ncbi:MAG: TrkA C-terminal domain-containing protein [Waltera sp.]
MEEAEQVTIFLILREDLSILPQKDTILKLNDIIVIRGEKSPIAVKTASFTGAVQTVDKTLLVSMPEAFCLQSELPDYSDRLN